MRLILLPVIAVLLGGCLTSQPDPAPEWVQKPPAATAQTLYGVSVASTKQEAEASAAGGIASSIFDTAEYRLRQTSGMAPALSKAMKNVLSSLDYGKAVLVKQSEIEKPADPDDTDAETKTDTAVLVSIERGEITAQLKTRLESRKARLEQGIETAGKAAAFMQMAQWGLCHEERNLLTAEAVLLETLDPASDSKPYRAFVAECETTYNRLKFESSAAVISDANAIVFVDILKKALVAEGISPNGMSGKNAAAVSLLSDRQQNRNGNVFAMTVRIKTATRSDGTEIAASEHFYSAKSRESYDAVQKRIADQLAVSIRSEGLFHILGF